MVDTYKTSGTCSRSITVEVEKGILKSVRFEGGCNGNLNAISTLCSGMKIDDIIDKLEGIKCGYRNTSCPDQLAKALISYKAKKGD